MPSMLWRLDFQLMAAPNIVKETGVREEFLVAQIGAWYDGICGSTDIGVGLCMQGFSVGRIWVATIYEHNRLVEKRVYSLND